MKFIAFLALLLTSTIAQATTVTIHTNDARATLLALKNPNLTHDQAHTIAFMHGNQAILRKLHEFKLTPTTDDFADALYNLAHHQQLTTTNQKNIYLETVQPKADQLLALLTDIESHPDTFQRAIEQRIALYTPPNANIHLEGYVLAGGGYTFGDTDFFLNIGMIDDIILSRSVTTHELYHAVQGAYATSRALHLEGDTPAIKACTNTEQLFANLYEEGTAELVADPSLILQSHSAAAARMLADSEDGLKHIVDSSRLLEMSVTSLSSPSPVPFDDVYSVGFFGHGVLYNIGLVMSRSIAEHDGPQGITALLQQPPYRFILHYAELPAYGKDKDHPALGSNTLAAARTLAAGCH